MWVGSFAVVYCCVFVVFVVFVTIGFACFRADGFSCSGRVGLVFAFWVWLDFVF